MAKRWVLDTSTKGTGASMVPLENVLRKPSERTERIFVPPPPRPKPAPDSGPRRSRLFKVIDIVSRQVLTEGAQAREAVAVLNRVRSIVDVHVYVWEPKSERWHLLSLEERRVLWDARTAAERPADAIA